MSKKNPIQDDMVITKKQQSSYYAAKLRKLVKEGKKAKEIMEALDISHSQVLKHHRDCIIAIAGKPTSTPKEKLSSR